MVQLGNECEDGSKHAGRWPRATYLSDVKSEAQAGDQKFYILRDDWLMGMLRIVFDEDWDCLNLR